jgi:hypothetical protein
VVTRDLPTPHRAAPPAAPGPGAGQRVFGTLLLLGTSGLVSCHALVEAVAASFR